MINKKILAIIPARGGSKGIPKKNIKELLGKPLIYYSIIEALKSKFIEKVVVSTDCIDIADVSRSVGAEVVMRPDSISGDKASSEEAIIHTLDILKLQDNYVPDIVVFIQCTSPLTLCEDIDGLIKKLISDKADSGLTVCKFYHFIWKNENGIAVGINHNKAVRPMRQDRDPQFLENGALYVFKTIGFLQNRYRFFGKTIFYEMPTERNLEIDEPFDFFLAESYLKRQICSSIRNKLPENLELLVMDFDGVFTDNSVYVLEDGREAVKCSRGDGMGLSMLKKKGSPMLVFSTEENKVVSARCKKLGIEVIQNVSDKQRSLNILLQERNIHISNIIYIGNDVNDLECIINAGCGIAVNDAVDEVKNNADIILKSNGGNGALRELAEMILNLKF